MLRALKLKKSVRLSVIAGSSVAALALAGCGGNVQSNAGEEDFPTGDLTLTVPFAPGGSSDLTGRAIAQALEDPLGQSMVVQNKAGANGGVGTDEALNTAADGYNVLFASESLYSITPLFVEDASATTLEDMEIVAPLSQEGYVLVVNAESEFEDLDDLLAKDGLKFATSGVGSGSQFSCTALFSVAGASAEDVPFDGGNPAVTSLMGGHTDATCVQVAEAKPRVEDGSFRALAVFSEERSEYLPEVPTATELGHDIVVSQRRWLAVPAGTPENVVSTLADAAQTAKDSESFQEFLETGFIDAWNAESSEVAGIVESDAAKYAQMAEQFGIGAAAS